MLRLFDYIFYRVSNAYITRWRDEQGMIYGIGVVSIMQMTHIIFVFIVLSIFSTEANEIIFKQGEGKNFMHSGIIYPCLILLAYNFYRYFKIHPYEKVKLVWADEKIETKRKKGWVIVLYIVLNLIVTISISIYRRYFI